MSKHSRVVVVASNFRSDYFMNNKKGERATLLRVHIDFWTSLSSLTGFRMPGMYSQRPMNGGLGYFVCNEDEHLLFFAAVLALVVEGYSVFGLF